MAERKKQSPVDIVIPYLATGSVWDELLYLLRSIEKNAAFEHRIVLISDVKPRFANDNLRFIKVDKLNTSEDPFSKCYDGNNKLVTLANLDEISENFIMAYADQLWLDKIHKSFVAKNKAFPQIKSANEVDTSYYTKLGSGYWKEALINTLELLWQKGETSYIYETHIPRVFSKKEILKTFEHFSLNIQSPVLFSTLYFNISSKKPTILNQNTKAIKLLRKHYSLEEIADIFSSYKFCDYKPFSLGKNLKLSIEEFFPTPSKYEK